MILASLQRLSRASIFFRHVNVFDRAIFLGINTNNRTITEDVGRRLEGFRKDELVIFTKDGAGDEVALGSVSISPQTTTAFCTPKSFSASGVRILVEIILAAGNGKFLITSAEGAISTIELGTHGAVTDAAENRSAFTGEFNTTTETRSFMNGIIFIFLATLIFRLGIDLSRTTETGGEVRIERDARLVRNRENCIETIQMH